MDRRTFLTRVGATGAAVTLAGCNGNTVGDAGNSATEITWVMNPAQEAIDIQVQYQPLFEYLESEADVEIIEQPTASYSGTAQELRRAAEGDRLFADTSPGAVAQIPEELDARTAHSGRPHRRRGHRCVLHGGARPTGAVRRDVPGLRRHLRRVRWRGRT